MKEELHKTLENEDQRADLLHKKLKELEQLVSEKNKELQNKDKTLSKFNHKYKKMKKEKKELLSTLTELKTQHENSLRLNEQLQGENSQFKDNQLDFQTILNEKIEQITKELKGEREKRLAEQSYSRVFILYFFILEPFLGIGGKNYVNRKPI